MEALYRFISWLDRYVEKPPMYGLFHISWIIGLLLICMMFFLISKNYKSEKFFKITLLVSWILLIFFEIIKEIIVGISFDSNYQPHFSYNLYYLPYQLCSLPFYVLPFIIFLKNEKIRDYFVFPTVSFILLGGLLLVLIPGGYKNSFYLNIHTMLHHCLQVFTSFVCIIWYKDKMTFKNYFKCIPLLVFGMALSIFLNALIYKVTNETVQFWNLSPYVVFDLEILENIRNSIGYIPYVLLYFVLIILLSFIIYIIPSIFKNKKSS